MPERQDVTYGPCYEPYPGFGPTTPITLPEAYLAEVHDCQALGGFGVVLADGEALLDIALGSDRFDLTSGEPMPVANRDTVGVNAERVESHHISEGILMESWFAANYHHWLVEHLTKLSLVEDVDPTVPLLVDAKALDIPQLGEALRALTDRPVIGLQWNVLYPVDHLWVPSNLFGTSPGLKHGLEVEIGDATVAREGIKWLRDRLAPPRPWPYKGRRVYIDRRAVRAPVRLTNGDEVRYIFEEFGFETVRPAEMSFAEQRDTFGHADVIAGESGAGMTNVLLAPASTVMVCMQARRWPLNIYSDLAAYGKQRSFFLVGDSIPSPAVGQNSFKMDGDLLNETLARILPA
jgi:capsular polysaccharide biosynthesis protein